MMTFDNLWFLLYNHGATNTKRIECAELWEQLTPAQQSQLVTTISTKIKENKFIHYDPLRAMQENIRQTQKQPQTLSFADYYARYGTTEPQDGWRMANPTGQKVIFVKQ